MINIMAYGIMGFTHGESMDVDFFPLGLKHPIKLSVLRLNFFLTFYNTYPFTHAMLSQRLLYFAVSIHCIFLRVFSPMMMRKSSQIIQYPIQRK